jgi:hypothetical protein
MVVTVGSRDNFGKRTVSARCRGREHRDKFDVDDNSRLARFRSEVVSTFLLDDSAHEWLQSQVLDQSRAMDSKSNIELVTANVVSLATLKPKATRWFWDGYMPSGAISVLDGDPNEGKSTICCDIIARGSRGDGPPPFSAPDGTFDVVRSLILQGEDSVEHTTIPRLLAAGANLENVSVLRTLTVNGEDDRIVQLPLDLDIIEQIIVEKEIGLVVVDVLSAFVQDGFNLNSDSDMRKCLTPMAISAERTGATWLILRHLNKKEGTRALYRGGGSVSITGAARAAFAVGPHPDDPSKKVFVAVKHNLGPRPDSLVYTIEAAHDSSRIAWEGGTTLTAADVLGATGSGGKGGKTDLAKEIILGILEPGPRGENEVKGACEQAGVSESTYWRARKSLGILSEKSGFRGEWLLSLPAVNGVNHESF